MNDEDKKNIQKIIKFELFITIMNLLIIIVISFFILKEEKPLNKLNVLSLPFFVGFTNFAYLLVYGVFLNDQKTDKSSYLYIPLTATMAACYFTPLFSSANAKEVIGIFCICSIILGTTAVVFEWTKERIIIVSSFFITMFINSGVIGGALKLMS